MKKLGVSGMFFLTTDVPHDTEEEEQVNPLQCIDAGKVQTSWRTRTSTGWAREQRIWEFKTHLPNSRMNSDLYCDRELSASVPQGGEETYTQTRKGVIVAVPAEVDRVG